MTTAHPDQTAQKLMMLVEHLGLIRDKGWKQGRSIREQQAWREGISAAMRAMASTALLITMDEVGTAHDPMRRATDAACHTPAAPTPRPPAVVSE